MRPDDAFRRLDSLAIERRQGTAKLPPSRQRTTPDAGVSGSVVQTAPAAHWHPPRPKINMHPKGPRPPPMTRLILGSVGGRNFVRERPRKYSDADSRDDAPSRILPRFFLLSTILAADRVEERGCLKLAASFCPSKNFWETEEEMNAKRSDENRQTHPKCAVRRQRSNSCLHAGGSCEMRLWQGAIGAP